MIWFLHSKLLLGGRQARGQTPRKLLPLESVLLAGAGGARPLCLAGGRQVALACISKPSVPLVALKLNDEFLGDFQLRGIALPAVRWVLVCI